MKIIPRIPKKDSWNLVPNFQYRKLFQHLRRENMNFFFIFYAFLNEHTYLLMVVIDVVMFKYLTFCVITNNFQKFLGFSSELFVNFFHDFDINRICWHLNVKVNFFDKFNEVNFLGRNNVPNVSVYNNILIINFEFFEFYFSVSLVNCVLFNLLKINTWISLCQIKILTTYHSFICFWLIQLYLSSNVILFLITV